MKPKAKPKRYSENLKVPKARKPKKKSTVDLILKKPKSKPK